MNLNAKNLPNTITALRMVGTLVLLMTKPMTRWFYIVYLLTGLTDVLDGFIARKLKLTSDFGAKLDSIADLLFYFVMLVLLMPTLWNTLHSSIWYGVIVALFFRLTAYILSAVRFRKFAASHSILNKITGFCVFLIPFILLTNYSSVICWGVTIIGIISSFFEVLKYCLTENGL